MRAIKFFYFNRMQERTQLLYKGLNSIKALLFRWDTTEQVNWGILIISFIGMAGPIFFGILFNQLHASLLASLGAMFVTQGSSSPTLKKLAADYLMTILAGASSIFLGSLLGGQNWITALVIVCISFLVALITGLDKKIARLAIQFLVFFIIGTGLGSNWEIGLSLKFALVFGIGAVWSTLLLLIFNFCFKRGIGQFPASAKAIPFKKIYHHWVRTLRHFKGWEFPIRMGLCMITAEAIGLFLGQELSHWIPFTVALITHPHYSSALQRIFQRGIGTVMGVMVGSILLIIPLPHAAIALIVGSLAAFRPILKKRNYLLYSMLMTPLMVISSSLHSNMTGGILFVRLLDTIIGCIISFLLGYIIWRRKAKAT